MTRRRDILQAKALDTFREARLAGRGMRARGGGRPLEPLPRRSLADADVKAPAGYSLTFRRRSDRDQTP